MLAPIERHGSAERHRIRDGGNSSRRKSGTCPPALGGRRPRWRCPVAHRHLSLSDQAPRACGRRDGSLEEPHRQTPRRLGGESSLGRRAHSPLRTRGPSSRPAVGRWISPAAPRHLPESVSKQHTACFAASAVRRSGRPVGSAALVVSGHLRHGTPSENIDRFEGISRRRGVRERSPHISVTAEGGRMESAVIACARARIGRSCGVVGSRGALRPGSPSLAREVGSPPQH